MKYNLSILFLLNTINIFLKLTNMNHATKAEAVADSYFHVDGNYFYFL